jgi:hypothetical protein
VVHQNECEKDGQAQSSEHSGTCDNPQVFRLRIAGTTGFLNAFPVKILVFFAQIEDPEKMIAHFLVKLCTGFPLA